MPATQRRPRQTLNSVEDLRQRLRQQSEFEAQTGWCQFYHAWRAELPRLCPGLSCRSLIDAISSEVNIQAAKAKKSGKQPSEWSPDLDKPALALECCTDKRTVDRDIKYLEVSGMAQVRHSIRGTVSVRLMYRDWQNLPDYKPEDRKEPQPSAEPAEPKETVELVKAPRQVKAGEFSERIKIECPVSSFCFKAGGAVDMAFTAVVKGGELLVCSEALQEFSTDRSQKNHVSNVSNKLHGEQKANARHARLHEQQKSTGYPQQGENKAKGEVKAKHPRADELARLFDPILLKSCQRSLSADQVAFDQALNALGDLSHDFLVKFVIQRAERPISSPKVCASIVKDALVNWRASKDLPPGMPVQRSGRMTPTEQAIELAKRRRQERA
jgi:hypothetical protein